MFIVNWSYWVWVAHFMFSVKGFDHLCFSKSKCPRETLVLMSAAQHRFFRNPSDSIEIKWGFDWAAGVKTQFVTLVCVSGWGKAWRGYVHAEGVGALRECAELVSAVGNEPWHVGKSFFRAHDNGILCLCWLFADHWFDFSICRRPTPAGICSACARSGTTLPKDAGKLRWLEKWCV